MKVLHVLYSKIYTGAEKVAAQIIKAFEGRVDMAYCSLECEEVWEILDGMGIRHYGVEKLTPATLSRVIREYRPDVIHAHDMRTSFVASLCCGKIPLISHIQIKHPFVFPYHFVEFQDDRLQSQTSHPPHRFSYLPSLLSHLRDCGYNPADRLFCLHPVLTPAVYYKYFLRPSEKAEFFLHILFFHVPHGYS